MIALVALHGYGFKCDGRRPRWNDNRSVGIMVDDSSIDGLAIGRHRRNLNLDLIQQIRECGNIASGHRQVERHRDWWKPV
jgi:hypothetical protein